MPEVAARLEAVSKRFGVVQALDDVSFELCRGEIHGLVGENGAGKSTLMRILAGVLSADSGVLFMGEREEALGGKPRGQMRGIGFMQQEGGMIPELTGAENLVLATGTGVNADRRRAERRLAELGAQFGLPLAPRVRVSEMSVGQQQRLEILTALAVGAQILVLDEPTAAMGTEDSALLSSVLRRLAAHGHSIVYISHKLQEVIGLADRVTVMRRGHVVATHQAGEVEAEQLGEEMIGVVEESRSAHHADNGDVHDEMLDIVLDKRQRKTVTAGAREVARLHAVSVPARRGVHPLENVDLVVHEGEILGVAGVIGNGQQTLAELLAGLVVPASGAIERRPGPVAYIPEDRHRDAAAVDLSVIDNTIVHSHRRPELGSGPWLRRRRVERAVAEIVTGANVMLPSLDAKFSTLSGGNQQRLVVGREMEAAPVMVVAHNPYRGLDVRAIRDVRTRLIEAAGRGAGIVLISPDLGDLYDLCERIAVLFRGGIVGEVSPGTTTVQELGKLMGGAA